MEEILIKYTKPQTIGRLVLELLDKIVLKKDFVPKIVRDIEEN